MVESGPFLIGGAVSNPRLLAATAGERARETEAAINELTSDAESRGLKPILLWHGDEPSARELAKKHPSLVAIVFSSSSIPRGKPLQEGDTWLLTPGEKCRALVSARWDGVQFTDYSTVPLGPEISDDEAASRAYSRYLDRVGSEELLMKLPRSGDKQFAGSAKCFSCHEKATKVWKNSEHGKALATLEADGHDKDPDCVGCHVVGLDSDSGFMTRATTPSMANVGCESCHGPGAEHVKSPTENRFGKSGIEACMKCHVVDHSPNFDFSSYWDKIRH